MIRICANCKTIMGEKEPFDDKSETHGLCDTCLAEEIRKIKQTQGFRVREERHVRKSKSS